MPSLGLFCEISSFSENIFFKSIQASSYKWWEYPVYQCCEQVAPSSEETTLVNIKIDPSVPIYIEP